MTDDQTVATDVAEETRRPGTRDPRRSRRHALKVLFQADLRGQDPSEAVAGIAIDPAAVALLDDLDVDDQDVPSGRAGLDDYARLLVDGVATNQQRLDVIISRFSHRWEVGRMPVVDRNLLRMGVWELLVERVAPAVVIDEAVELAKELAGDASHRFVNGILDSVRKDATALRAELAAPAPVEDPVEDPVDVAVDEPLDGPGDDALDHPTDDVIGDGVDDVVDSHAADDAVQVPHDEVVDDEPTVADEAEPPARPEPVAPDAPDEVPVPDAPPPTDAIHDEPIDDVALPGDDEAAAPEDGDGAATDDAANDAAPAVTGPDDTAVDPDDDPDDVPDDEGDEQPTLFATDDEGRAAG